MACQLRFLRFGLRLGALLGNGSNPQVLDGAIHAHVGGSDELVSPFLLHNLVDQRLSHGSLWDWAIVVARPDVGDLAAHFGGVQLRGLA
ncbi:hypothetical protein D3C71_1876620 [compost metagenome]